jgi:hypothetical protein
MSTFAAMAILLHLSTIIKGDCHALGEGDRMLAATSKALDGED